MSESYRIEEVSNIILTCFQCGTCTASCPIRRVTDEFNPVKISRMILLGLEEDLINNPAIWLCAKCNTCVERCPRGIAFVNVIRVLQNKATKRGKSPRPLREAAKNILKLGWVYNLSMYGFMREDLGLPSPVRAKVEAIRKIATRLGVSE
jgi:heterodisulfide reductase subunit C